MLSEPVTVKQKVSSAVFFGISSFLLVVINKIILTSWGFPSFQAVGVSQMVFAVVVLGSLRTLGFISFPGLTARTPIKMFPLPIFYLINLVFGLGGTKHINLPMFTVLRRFAILIAMILEYFLMGIRTSHLTNFTVFLMMAGAFVAAADDLTFSLKGYTYVTINNICNASNNVVTKMKINSKDFDIGKYGMIFYNTLFMVVPATIIMGLSGDIEKVVEYEHLYNPEFLFYFALASGMGMVLMYSTMLCTLYNSALATSVVGLVKNLLVTYVGMVVGGDYVFSWVNFIGLNISCLGSIIYTLIAFRSETKPADKPSLATADSNANSFRQVPKTP